MKNLEEISEIVQGYLDDDSAVVDQPIIDTINFLSNIFSIDSLDESQSTAVDGTSLNIPTDCLEVDTVFVNGEEVLKLKSLDDLDGVVDAEEQRWYEFDGKIQFTEVFTAVEETKIWYKKGFTEPEAAIDTDVPEKYLELVYIGAQYRYYNILVNRLVLKKVDSKLKPDEIRKVSNEIKKNFFELIKSIQLNS